MGDPGDGHLQGIVVYLVDDPVIALTQPIGPRTDPHQPPGLRRARVVREGCYSLFHPFPVPDREFGQSPVRRAGYEYRVLSYGPTFA